MLSIPFIGDLRDSSKIIHLPFGKNLHFHQLSYFLISLFSYLAKNTISATSFSISPFMTPTPTPTPTSLSTCILWPADRLPDIAIATAISPNIELSFYSWNEISPIPIQVSQSVLEALVYSLTPNQWIQKSRGLLPSLNSVFQNSGGIVLLAS